MARTRQTASAPFGWRGIRLDTPPDWEPAILEGDAEQGYARLDDMDAIRFELRWNPVSGDPTPEELRDQMLGKLLGGHGDVKAEAMPPLRHGDGGSYFRWRGEVAALGRVSFCPQTKRAVLGQVIFPDGRENRAEACAVLGSIEDRAAEKTALWSLYGFSAEVDSSWRLTEWGFSVGQLEFCFERPAQRLRFKRWGPAEVLLRNYDFDTWHRLMVLPTFGKVDRTEVIEVAAHEGIAVTRTRPAGSFGALVSRLANPRSAWRRWNTDSLAWHCPQTNRLFVWEHASRRAGVRRDWRIDCHREEQP